MNTHSIDLELSSSQYLSITDGDQTGLNITGDFTIECWVKLRSQPATGQYVLIAGKGSSNGYKFQYRDEAGTNKFESYIFQDNTVTDYSFFKTAYTLPLDTWTHIAWTVNVSNDIATKFEMFVNGISIGNGTQSGNAGSGATSIYDNNSPYLIGSNGAGDYLDGLVDDVRMWNDVRTQSEISDNYQQEISGGSAGLVGYWQLNNDLLDQTSNDNDLTNNNSALFSEDIPFGAEIDYSLEVIVGTFALTGINIGLSKGYNLAVNVGAFTLTGIDLAFKRTITMIASVGEFTLTGVDLTLSRGLNMIASVGTFALTGVDVIFDAFIRTRWKNQTKNLGSFTNQAKTGKDENWNEADYSWDDAQGTWDKQFSVFNKQTKNSASFTNKTKN